VIKVIKCNAKDMCLEVVFKTDKSLTESVDLTVSGRLFQTIGPATEKAQSSNVVRVRGTMKSRLLAERRRCRTRSLQADATDSLGYKGQ